MGVIAFLYGAASYAAGLVALLYAIGFVGGLLVPKAIDSGQAGALPGALLVDVLLVGLFAVQHTIMARRGFKQWWTRLVPEAVERSTFVLASSLALAALFWQWQPIAGTAWSAESPVARFILWALFALGWAIALASTFMISHFDLFGLRQVTLRLKGEPYRPVPFVKAALYRFVRHPLMLGLLIAFWATPDMSYGHLLFSLAMTGYIFFGISLEERDLRRSLGAAYDAYRRETSMLIPLP